MNRTRKRLMAGAAALAIGALGAAGLQGIANAYGPTSTSLPGSLFLNNTAASTTATTNNTFTDTLTLSNSPANPNAGDSVTVTLSGVNGPSTGPVGVAANGTIVRATIDVSGAQTATVSLASGATCTYPATPIGTSSPEGAWTTTGSFTASGNGAAVIALKQILFDDQGNGAGGVDGQQGNVCSGTANNADYYISAVTQTAGSGQAGLAKTAPQVSSVVKNNITITGPNATIATSSGQNAGVAAVRNSAAYGVTVTVTGTVWGNNVAAGGFTASYCDLTGNNCDTGITNTLTTDGSGVISGGSIVKPGGVALTAGNRTLKLVQGSNQSLTPVLVLDTAAITLSPTGGGPGTPVAISGSNFNPSQAVTAYGSSLTGPPYTATADSSVGLGNANGSGLISGSFTVNDPTTVRILAYQGIPGLPSASNPAAAAAFAVSRDRCIAYQSDLTGGPGCDTKQNVNVSVLQGQLTQRAYVNTTPTNNSTSSSASTPVVGTSNVNSDATTINLGTITSPFAPTVITGTLNDITVSDNRGGTYGWTLSAVLTNFSGTPTGTLSNALLKATPSCAAATNATAWDYTNANKVAISGFDDTLNAPGASAGGAAQAFSSTVNLCTKSTATNATTQSTGGVYNIGSSLDLTVPAFQLAARYVATMTITLA